MRVSKRVLVLGLAALRSAGRCLAGGFEGQVDMKMTQGNSGKSTAMSYYVKGNKIRVEIDNSDGEALGSGIMDLKTHQYIAVMDKQKMYMVSQLHPEKFSYGKDHHFKMNKTGRSEKILGYSCQEWDYTSDEGSGKIWFAKGIGNWWGTSMAAQSDKLSPSQKAMVKMVLSEKLFPMKYEFSKKSGEADGTMEVTRIEKKSLSSGMFKPPAGYKKMEMPSLGGSPSGKKPSKEDIMKMIEQYKH